MKKIRFILPIAAIMFAVVGVFATGNSTLTEEVSVNSGTCTLDGTCSQATSALCQLQSNTSIKFNIIDSSPACSVQSTGTFTETP